MDDNQDENLKKAKQATDMFMLQQKAKDYQDKFTRIQNNEYQGKYKGISCKMKGDGTILEVHIDQSFYETASKGQIEAGIMRLINNLHSAVNADQDHLKNEIQLDINSFQKEQYNGNN